MLEALRALLNFGDRRLRSKLGLPDRRDGARIKAALAKDAHIKFPCPKENKCPHCS